MNTQNPIPQTLKILKYALTPHKSHVMTTLEIGQIYNMAQRDKTNVMCFRTVQLQVSLH